MTCAFSSSARGIADAFMAMLDGKEHAILPFRQQTI